MEDTKLLLSITEAAGRLGIGRSHLYELVLAGQVESVKLGRRRLIPTEALERFVKERLEAAVV